LTNAVPPERLAAAEESRMHASRSPRSTDSAPPAIHAALFDVGGVLSEDMIERKLRDLAGRYGVEEERLLAAGEALRARADLGQITDAEFWRLALERVGVTAGPEDHEIESYLVPIAGTLDIARQLKARGLRVGILSNDSREMSRARRRRHGFDEVFDPILISSELGAMKPDAGIYDHALAHLGLAGARCLFVDNREDNVEGARRRGMRVIQFTSAAELRRELEAMGLL
jgi:HAD superfamily hydrolase (TIGR01509 family)